MNKKNRRGDIVLFAAGILCLIVFTVTTILLLNYCYESWQQEKLNRQLESLKYGTASDAMYVMAEPIVNPSTENTQGNASSGEQLSSGEHQPTGTEEQFAEAPGKQQEALQGLADINPDYVMWLQIADTVIDYPVVQRDNSFYLKHDFYGEKSKHGTIFLDEGCDAEGRFLLLHGHHMKDGTMFGSLKKYKKADFREVHRDLTLEWEQVQENYEVFAAALIDLLQAERFRYEKMPEDEEDIKAYLQQLEAVAFWYEEPEWQDGERFVILSTCDYGTMEERLILVAVEKK